MTPKENSKDAAVQMCCEVWKGEHIKIFWERKTYIYLTVVAEYCCNCFIFSLAEMHLVWVLGTKLYSARAVYTKCGAISQIPN